MRLPRPFAPPSLTPQAAPADGRARENALGAAAMSLSMAGFVLNDALMKLAFETVPLFQAIFLRGLMATALLLALAAARRELRPKVARADRPIFALRTLSEIGATICFLTALSRMPIADATAILQALPLTITLGAALIYREPVGWRRWTAIAVGFAGVLTMLRPGAEGFDANALWALAAVGFVSARDLLTRRLSAGAPSVFVALLSAAAIAAVGGAVAATQSRAPVSAADLALLLGAAAFLLAAYVSAVGAARLGDIGFTAPFRYTVLLWATLLGWALFDELPDAQTLIGAGIVAAAALYALSRERRRRAR